MTATGEDLRCPVCRAPFRGTGDCSRCGADLRRLMRLVVSAHAARQTARRALVVGDAEQAETAIRLAQNRHQTLAGARLASLSALVLLATSPATENTPGRRSEPTRPAMENERGV